MSRPKMEDFACGCAVGLLGLLVMSLLFLWALPAEGQTTLNLTDIRDARTGQPLPDGTIFDGVALGHRAECVIAGGVCRMVFAETMKEGGACVWERGTDPMACTGVVWATVSVPEAKKPRRRAVKR